MNQFERKKIREKELAKAKELVYCRSKGICEHCRLNIATDFSHNIPRKTDNYKYYSDIMNINHFCRSCHSLYDSYKVKEFAKINIENFFDMMNFLLSENQTNRYYKYMALFADGN